MKIQADLAEYSASYLAGYAFHIICVIMQHCVIVQQSQMVTGT